jgi:NAD(P)-dependent dehydrogenase (short-subunit alcohol dehydrogenase family)
MSIRFDGRVAVVTGAGAGLGRCHALELARRGARVVVNDLGTSVGGLGRSSAAAEAVADAIRAGGGEALVDTADVAQPDEVARMFERALALWGRIDILVNNAGILRDRTFAKAALEDFRAVLDVHLMGAVHCTKAAWEPMVRQRYGRVLLTTSAAGLYGHFGQAGYGAAKLALVGLMNTLHLEGARHGIRVNAISPAAGTRMVGEAVPDAVREALAPEKVTAGAVFLVSDDAPSGVVLGAGGGAFTRVRIGETDAAALAADEVSAERVADAWAQLRDAPVRRGYASADEQVAELLRAARRDEA